MSEAPRGQLVYDGVISRRRGDAKEVGFAPEAKRKEKLRPLRVARMLALAHECEALIAARIVADRAELAGVLGFTRARVTQLMDLTLLAPDIQEEILVAEVEPGRDSVTERSLRGVVALAARGRRARCAGSSRSLRGVVALASWAAQRARWRNGTVGLGNPPPPHPRT